MGGRKDLITAGLTLGALSGAAEKAKGKMSAIIATESGAVVSFTAADAAPVTDLTATIVPVQSGSGDPSPTNIRPISGWTECKVMRAGKNLINIPDQTNVTVSSINTTYNQIWNKIRFKANTVYTFSCDFSSSDTTHTWGIRVIYTNGDVSYLWIHNKTVNKHSVTTMANASIDMITFAYDLQHTISVSNFQFEEGSTATAYEPCRGDTYTVMFGDAGTVYGGTLDVTTGTLTVTMAEVDLGTLDYLKTGASSNPVFSTSTIPNIKPNASSSSLANAICSAYKQVNYAELTADGTFCVIWAASSAAGKVYFKNMAYDNDDAAAFKAAMSGVQLVYELAEPIVYNLSPVEILTLAGQNTIWADTGSVTVKYATTDTKAFIDKYIAERRNG